MKHKPIIYLTSATLAAIALSFTPARGQTDERSTGTTTYTSPTDSPTDRATGTADQNGRWSKQDKTSDESAQTDRSRPAKPSTHTLASTESESSSTSLRRASKDESRRTADHLAGKKLKGQDGKDLGTVKDFLIDPQSGQVRFAVVSTGGFAGIGDELHLVPFESLQQQSDAKGFTAAMTKQELSNAQVVNEESFEENRVAASGPEQSSSSAIANSAAFSGNLIRASKIKGRDVTANGNKIGRIEGIVIEPGTQDVMALLKPEKDVAGSDDEFLVPLNKFTIAGTDQKEITTTLSRTDFQSVSASGETASTSTPVENSSVADTSTTPSSGAVASTEQTQNVMQGTAAMGAGGPTGGAAMFSQQSATASTGTNSNTSLSSTATTSGLADQASSGANYQSSGSGFGSLAHSSSSSTSSAQSSEPGQASSASSPSSSMANTESSDAGLTPTGQTSAVQNPSADASLITAAQAIRRALDNDPQFARANVQVLPENGKVMLRGSVSDDAQKSAIEQKAQHAAGGADIDASELKVENK